MAEVKQKITALKIKISKREDKLARIDKRIFGLKADYKAVKKDIDELNDEVRRLELQQLSDTLERNGITANDVAAAIADGSIKKTAPAAESAGTTEKEVAVNEASGS